MGDVTITVVIPTVGRDTLQRTLDSCQGADEVIVVENQDGDHGYTARTKGMSQATGSHICFMDDDDVYLPGAFDLMRAHATNVPVIFRMDHYAHGILWRNPVLEFGNVSTQMFVVPNVPDALGVWAPHIPGLKEPGGDYTFLKGCVEKMGGPVWREEVIAMLRPDRRPTISVVTPWLNHLELVKDYTAALIDLRTTDRLIVVDNGSTPPVGLDGIRLERNAGFSEASNLGLKAADTNAVLFLNNDVYMTGRTWLETLRSELEPGVLVGANLRYDPHGAVDGHELPYLDGWCLAGMRDDLLELGGFDQGYEEPSYYSDNDLCLRARTAGMRLKEARLSLHHKLNQTAADDKPAVARASAANRERFARLVRETLALA